MHPEVDIPHASSTLQQDTPNNSTNNSSPGWNHLHSYNTRFKKRIHANLASTAPSADHLPSIDFTTLSALLATHDHLPSFHENILHDQPYLAFGTKSNPDVLHFSAMQHAPNRSDFEKDMIREITDFFDNKCVAIVPASEIPPNEKPLQAIWSFRRKRAPDWTITKCRSCLCPHGGQQVEGLNFWDTYAPVVSWRTIPLTLVLGLLSNLKT
jgi:hypothetical protein